MKPHAWVGLKAYLDFINKVSKYHSAGEGNFEELHYLTHGLTGEAGEFADEVKKLTGHMNQRAYKRYKNMALEIGDVLFHVIRLIDWLGLTPEEVIKLNMKKLTKRYESGRIHSG